MYKVGAAPLFSNKALAAALASQVFWAGDSSSKLPWSILVRGKNCGFFEGGWCRVRYRPRRPSELKAAHSTNTVGDHPNACGPTRVTEMSEGKSRYLTPYRLAKAKEEKRRKGKLRAAVASSRRNSARHIRKSRWQPGRAGRRQKHKLGRGGMREGQIQSNQQDSQALIPELRIVTERSQLIEGVAAGARGA